MAFTCEDIRPGDRVTFLAPNGKSRRSDGSVRQDYHRKTGRVTMNCGTHLVVNGGGRCGTPFVVDENNFTSAVRPYERKRAARQVSR